MYSWLKLTLQDPKAGICTTRPRRPSTHRVGVGGFPLRGFESNFYFCNLPGMKTPLLMSWCQQPQGTLTGILVSCGRSSNRDEARKTKSKRRTHTIEGKDVWWDILDIILLMILCSRKHEFARITQVWAGFRFSSAFLVRRPFTVWALDS